MRPDGTESPEDEQPLSPEERAVMLALNEVLIRVEEAPYEEMVAALEAVERRFAVELAHDPAGVLEVRRRVAEGRLMVATVYKKPVEHCQVLLDAVQALGWASLEVKAGVLAGFAKHCVDAGRRELAAAILEPLGAELRVDLANSGASWAGSHLAAVQRILALATNEESSPSGDSK